MGSIKKQRKAKIRKLFIKLNGKLWAMELDEGDLDLVKHMATNLLGNVQARVETIKLEKYGNGYKQAQKEAKEKEEGN